jgi:hypothetical protein
MVLRPNMTNGVYGYELYTCGLFADVANIEHAGNTEHSEILRLRFDL